MTKNQKTYLILGVGAVALFLWYRSRSGGSSLFGSLLGGQGTAGSGGVGNTSFTGSGSMYSATDPQLSDADHLRARNLATGALSRGQCLFPAGRWIDTSTPPYYGLCVTQAKFDEWMRVPSTGYTGGYPSLDYVKRVLSLR